MKDGTTHLAYKAEHAVDLTTNAIVAATVASADRGDSQTGPETLIIAQAALIQSRSTAAITEVVADKGYHYNRLLAHCVKLHVRTYIPERKQKHRRWTDKPTECEAAFRANRRRVQSEKGRRLSLWRSERCERTFAHVCETGGGRRTWLRGLGNVTKAQVLRCAAYNLGLLLRKMFGLGKPQSHGGRVGGGFVSLASLAPPFMRSGTDPGWLEKFCTGLVACHPIREWSFENSRFLTGC